MQRPAKPFTPVRFRIQPPIIMKIGIIGYGFVGKALFNGLTENVDVLKIDPKLNNSIDKILDFNPQIIFICLPTPMKTDGSQDISIVKTVLDYLSKINISSLIVVKSTIHPGNISEIENIVPNFIYNPEFLREKHANQDFLNSDLIVFGGKKNSVKKVAEFYSSYTKCVCKDYVFTDTCAASLIKYSINSFLATKTIFFNEMHNLFLSSQTNEKWENFIKFIANDKRIGDSHMMVPGHDGRYGFGGACLPKDSAAIIKFAESLDIELGTLKNVVSTNNKIRAKYNSNTNREDDQNINYDIFDKE